MTGAAASSDGCLRQSERLSSLLERSCSPLTVVVGDRQIHRLQQSCLSWTLDIDRRSPPADWLHVLGIKRVLGKNPATPFLNISFSPRDGVRVCQYFLAVIFTGPAFFHIKDVAPGKSGLVFLYAWGFPCLLRARDLREPRPGVVITPAAVLSIEAFLVRCLEASVCTY